jgi:hypothetical protein
MAQTAHNLTAPASQGHRGAVMAIVLVLATLGLLILGLGQPTRGPAVQTEGNDSTVSRSQPVEDWHGNYNAVRR